MKMRHLIIAALIGSGATAAAAEVLVVRATGPSAKNFPAGRQLADNAKITLAANDQLVVLDQRGTRTLRGPGTFTPAGAPSQAAVMASSTPKPRARIGAVRSVGSASATALAPSLWHIDVTKSSNVCMQDPTRIMLWRANAATPTRLTVASGGKSKTLDWAAGQSAIAWPADVALRDGATYKLSWPGAAQPTTVTFKAVPPTKPAELDRIAESLIRNECKGQLDTLIETARVPGDAATPSG